MSILPYRKKSGRKIQKDGKTPKALIVFKSHCQINIDSLATLNDGLTFKTNNDSCNCKK